MHSVWTLRLHGCARQASISVRCLRLPPRGTIGAVAASFNAKVKHLASGRLQVYFKHKDTSAWLGSSKKTYRRPIDGHYEVVATSKKDSMAAWVASMGVFFPKREPQPRAPAANGAKEDL